MSMIRPPGTSSVPRFRPVNTRRRVKGVSIALATCAVIGASAWAFGVNSDASSRPDCERAPYVAPTPDRVPVNVYNSTQIVGLAEAVKVELEARGFTVGKVENDPLRRNIRGTGELRGGPLGERQIDALRAWQPGMVVLVDDRRKGPEVDFVLGAKFDKLNDVPEPPPGAPPPACVPVAAAG